MHSFPFAMGGLQDLDPKVAEKAVKPYVWPVQNEEWELDYWIAQGYTIFVVQDEELWLNSTVASYRKMHEQIKSRCELLATIPPNRPHFPRRA